MRSSFEGGQSVDDVRAKELSPLPLGDGALAVAYYKVEDGRVVLLHTEVAARAVRPGIRIAIGAWRFRSVATRWEMGKE
jgi:hypothetical protein